MNKSSQQNTSRISYLFSVAVLIFSFLYGALGVNQPVLAVTTCDTDFYSANNILFYNDCAESTDTCSTSASGSVYKNADYNGDRVFTDAQLQAIEDTKPFYQKAADPEDIPWQILAAIHMKETGLKQYGPTNGYGPYQITSDTYPVKDSYSNTEFQDASDKAASFIKETASGRDLTDPNVIKSILFAKSLLSSPSGASDKYIAQAVSLGFSDEEAVYGEGSPYVMNRFDQNRDPTVEPTIKNNTWGQIKPGNTDISYPADPVFGVYVYYSALTNNALCGGASAFNGDANTVLTAFNSYMNSNNQSYAPLNYVLGINGCTTLSSWYIGEYTTLAYGRGNGEAVVRNLVSVNGDKGVSVTDKPIAPSLYSVASGVKAWGSTGGSPGHVGLVVSVDEQNQTAIVLQTGSSFAGKTDKAVISTYKYPTSGVSFVYIGDNLK